MYYLRTTKGKLTEEDLAIKQPLFIQDIQGHNLVLFPNSFLEKFDDDRVEVAGEYLREDWSWNLEESYDFRDLNNAKEWRARWCDNIKRNLDEIKEAIKIANEGIKFIDKNGLMYCLKCDIKWNWDENVPNSSYNDLSCPLCGKISKEV